MILFGVWSVKKRLSLVTLPLAVIMIRGFQKLLMGWALFLYHVMMVYGMVVWYHTKLVATIRLTIFFLSQVTNLVSESLESFPFCECSVVAYASQL